MHVFAGQFYPNVTSGSSGNEAMSVSYVSELLISYFPQVGFDTSVNPQRSCT